MNTKQNDILSNLPEELFIDMINDMSIYDIKQYCHASNTLRDFCDSENYINLLKTKLRERYGMHNQALRNKTKQQLERLLHGYEQEDKKQQ